jgi:hypothetical protein
MMITGVRKVEVWGDSNQINRLVQRAYESIHEQNIEEKSRHVGCVVKKFWQTSASVNYFLQPQTRWHTITCV